MRLSQAQLIERSKKLASVDARSHGNHTVDCAQALELVN
jgi:hypothetical protein